MSNIFCTFLIDLGVRVEAELWC